MDFREYLALHHLDAAQTDQFYTDINQLAELIANHIFNELTSAPKTDENDL